MTTINLRSYAWRALTLVLLALLAPPTAVALDSAKEQKLITLLQSSAPPEEKALACKQLTVCGSQAAVPALSALLSDERLASWSRIALEAIPGPAADDALRQVLNHLEGKLLVGVINSIGVRRDPKAVKPLAAKLKSSDMQVAAAAASSLGRIGGPQAAKVLKKALASCPEAVCPDVAEGCIRCAEQFLVVGKRRDAVSLYDAVRRASSVQTASTWLRQKNLEATRGAILARQSKGIPLLIECLRSPDKDILGIGLSTARELPGTDVTKSLIAELERAAPERQARILLAIGDRGDASAMPAVVNAARSGSKPLRLVAVDILDRSGNAANLPVLLEIAAGPEADLARKAQEAIIRFGGSQVDSEIISRLSQASGSMRRVLIQIAAGRNLQNALPILTQSCQDPDKSVRAAALQAVGVLGEEKQAGELVALAQKTTDSEDRANIGKALAALCGRKGAGCAAPLKALASNDDAVLRTMALEALASAGGSQALEVVKAAVTDKDESVQDEAVRILANWPSTWPEDDAIAEPLLELAKSGAKPSYQVLALRGYLQHLQFDKKLAPEARLSRIKESNALIKRPEEKRLAISVLQATPAAGSLQELTELASDAAVTEDACAAIVAAAGKESSAISKEERQKALQMVVEKSANDSTKKKAEDLLKKFG
jgi:HEAT repeat protein